jgi:hypothetical protein
VEITCHDQSPPRAADETSRLTGYRRLNHRYERDPHNYLTFLGLAAVCCCKRPLNTM